ncbi:hypothetical protein [Natrarchaeobius chitinivorans]|uniref:Small CPxCG-related zinc finger protein n=1 Tax=Natrarchaeobius chitinivorans TaxID=1679083 RepID=A0A3N6PDG0_NATCH|nr:hypothetical protein [Natrarchaeobius chitinivorans]RQG95065.1 hypothetical protein EA473_08875 [Natrarchaeobius chitinivorans]
MTDSSEADADGDSIPNPEESSLRPCPICGYPIARTTIVGPTDAIAGPCGCHIAPPIPDSASDHE